VGGGAFPGFGECAGVVPVLLDLDAVICVTFLS